MENKPIGKWIGMLSRHRQTYLAHRLEPLGIGPGQYPLVLMIVETPGIRQDVLAEKLYLNKSSVARGVSHLEKNGFLIRKVDAVDKRAYCLYPTRQATGIYPDIIRLSQEANRAWTAGLSSEEVELLDSLLRHMTENAFAAKCRSGTSPNQLIPGKDEQL